MFYKLIIVFFTILLFQSCKDQENKSETASSISNKTERIVTKIDTVEVKMSELKWEGTYEGVLPCADCEGIRTVLVFSDGKCIKQERFLGKEEKFFVVNGTFSLDNDSNKVKVNFKGKDKYFLFQKGKLIQLDNFGNITNGALATNYVLYKKR